jgi:hypothetical protein
MRKNIYPAPKVRTLRYVHVPQGFVRINEVDKGAKKKAKTRHGVAQINSPLSNNAISIPAP